MATLSIKHSIYDSVSLSMNGTCFVSVSGSFWRELRCFLVEAYRMRFDGHFFVLEMCGGLLIPKVGRLFCVGIENEREM